MNLEIKGKVKHILPVVSGEGKNGTWQKRDFVIEFKDGEYTKNLSFSIWKNIDILDNIVQGSIVKVHFNIESKEYNEKWYTNAMAWKIEQFDEPTEDANDDMPF